MQLGAQHRKITVARRVQQSQFVFVRRYDHHVIRLRIKKRLYIEVHAGVNAANEFYAHFRFVRDGNGAIRQSVRRDRYQRNHRQAGLQNRPATGQGIRGRAGGGIHDDAVGAQRINKFAVHFDCELDHRPHRAATEDHIVERDRFENGFVTATNFRVQQKAQFFLVLAVEQRGHHRLQRFGGNVGEETKMAQIDADQWHAMRHHGAGQRQQRAITTDGDGQIGILQQRIHWLARHDRVGRRAHERGGMVVDAHRDAALSEQRDQLIHRLADACAIGLTDNRNRFESGFHCHD